MRTSTLVRGLLCALVALTSVARAEEPAAPETALAAVALDDQHGVSHRVDETTRAVLFTSDMDAGGVVKQALAEGGAERLARAGAVYVSDVSGMPAIIRRSMAEPAMRKRPYPILLDRDGDATKDWPRTPEQATLLVLDRLTIVRSDRLATPDAVRSALDALATPRARASKAAEGIDLLTRFADWTGSMLFARLGVRFAAGLHPYHLIVTNVAGPQVPLHLLGARVLAIFPQLPLFEQEGLGIAVFSYAGRISFALVGDWDVLTDLSELAASIERSFEELHADAVGPALRACVHA